MLFSILQGRCTGDGWPEAPAALICEQDGAYLFASWYIGLLQVIGCIRKKEHLGVDGVGFRPKGMLDCTAIVLAYLTLVTQGRRPC